MAIDKSDLTDAITSHFAALKNQHVEVPEWGSDDIPAVIFFDPVTVAERIELDRYTEDYLPRVLIRKALKLDGSKMFTLADLPTLMNSASALIVAQVANRILNADAIDPKLLGEYSPTGGKTEP